MFIKVFCKSKIYYNGKPDVKFFEKIINVKTITKIEEDLSRITFVTNSEEILSEKSFKKLLKYINMED